MVQGKDKLLTINTSKQNFSYLLKQIYRVISSKNKKVAYKLNEVINKFRQDR